jgi:hypothetical protein
MPQFLPVLPDAAMLHGRDAVIGYFRGVREGIDWSVEAQEFIDAGMAAAGRPEWRARRSSSR